MSIHEMILKLVLAVVLGALIGLERETHGRPAGLRTHILVCLGSTLFTLCSFEIAGRHNDPGRIAAQIVTGIGFLGAGTIMHQGSIVRGLTTAASIWTVAAIGVAIASGGKLIWVAAAASVVVYGTLHLIPILEERFILEPDERLLTANVKQDRESLCRVLGILAAHGARLHILGSEDAPNNVRIVRMRIKVDHSFDENAVGAELASSEDVISYSWE